MEIVVLLLQFAAFTWWLWLFAALFPVARSLWLFYKQQNFKKAINWSLVELRIPREVKRSAKAMEQVLFSIHSLRNAPSNFREKYIEGQVTRWFSLEIVSFGGEVHFYIRCPEQFKTLIQAPIFSYYPDVEVVDVEDYVETMPKNTGELASRDLDIWGTEIVLAKEAAYPIKTYPSFESASEDSMIDPIGNLLEVFGKLKTEEFAAVHLTVVPKDAKWRDEWRGEIEKIREGEAKPGGVKIKVEFPGGPLPVFTVGEKNKEGEIKIPKIPTPGTTETLKAVESNLSKPAFDTIIRLMYMGPKAAFYDSFVRAGVLGSFNQYSSLNLNAFKPNSKASTKAAPYKFPYVLVKERTEYKKQRFLYNFRHREIPENNFAGIALTSYPLNFNNASEYVTLSTESLATLFHIPTAAVTTGSHIRRVDSRKVGPPAGIAIFGEDEEIDRYK